MELPRLETIWRDYRDRGLAIVAVERRRDTERATRFIAEKELTFHLLENGEDDREVVRNIFGVGVFPTTYLIDRDGRIVFAHVGFKTGDEEKLESEIEKLLAPQGG